MVPPVQVIGGLGSSEMALSSVQNRQYPTMLLTVTGRGTDKAHTVPLIYITDGERLVIAAAHAGSDTDPSWWRDLQAHPRAVAQVNHDIVTVEAGPSKADERPDL